MLQFLMYFVIAFILIGLFTWGGTTLIKWFDRQPIPSEEQLARMLRDDELMLTYYVLMARLRRPPTVAEIWEASPPTFYNN